MSPAQIKEANKEVEKMKFNNSTKRGQYQKVSIETKTKIAKYAAENGVTGAVRKFKGNAPKNWENTVRDCFVAILQGSLPFAKQVAKAIENKPQSLVPCCCCGCTTDMLTSLNKHESKARVISSTLLL